MHLCKHKYGKHIGEINPTLCNITIQFPLPIFQTHPEWNREQEALRPAPLSGPWVDSQTLTSAKDKELPHTSLTSTSILLKTLNSILDDQNNATQCKKKEKKYLKIPLPTEVYLNLAQHHIEVQKPKAINNYNASLQHFRATHVAMSIPMLYSHCNPLSNPSPECKKDK